MAFLSAVARFARHASGSTVESLLRPAPSIWAASAASVPRSQCRCQHAPCCASCSLPSISAQGSFTPSSQLHTLALPSVLGQDTSNLHVWSPTTSPVPDSGHHTATATARQWVVSWVQSVLGGQPWMLARRLRSEPEPFEAELDEDDFEAGEYEDLLDPEEYDEYEFDEYEYPVQEEEEGEDEPGPGSTPSK